MSNKNHSRSASPDEASTRMLVLTYHGVFASHDDWFKEPPADRWYALRAEQFQQQLDFLAENGYTTCLLDEFLDSRSPAKSVILTFDDGHQSNFTTVLPILCRFGFRAEFFITVANVGRPGFMTWEQVRALAKAGMSVQSHGLYHRPLTTLAPEVLDEEIRTAKERLEANLHKEVKYFAIPGGFCDRGVYRAVLAAGHAAVCNSEPGLARRGSIIPRVAVMHATSQAEFADLVSQKFSVMCKMAAQRKLAKLIKAFVGVERYEALKASRIRNEPT